MRWPLDAGTYAAEIRVAPVAALRVPGATVSARLLVRWSSADGASLRNMEGIHAFADRDFLGQSADHLGAGEGLGAASVSEAAPFSLLLVSDNNLSEVELTQIVKFRVVGGVYAAEVEANADDVVDGRVDSAYSSATETSEIEFARGSAAVVSAREDEPAVAALGLSDKAAAVVPSTGSDAASAASSFDATSAAYSFADAAYAAAATPAAGMAVAVVAAAIALLSVHRRRLHASRRTSGDVEAALVVRTNAAGKMTMGNYSYGLIASPPP